MALALAVRNKFRLSVATKALIFLTVNIFTNNNFYDVKRRKFLLVMGDNMVKLRTQPVAGPSGIAFYSARITKTKFSAVSKICPAGAIDITAGFINLESAPFAWSVLSAAEDKWE
jgi:hypothetical protein